MKWLWLTLLILWGTAVSSRPLFAHAELTEAFPTPGSTVESLTEIRLVFSEPIGTNGQIQLHQDFVSVADLAPMVDPEDEAVLWTAVSPLPDGVYTVQWSVTSADGHPISGSYSLGIDSSPPQENRPWYLGGWALVGLLVGSLGVTAVILRRWRTAN